MSAEGWEVVDVGEVKKRLKGDGPTYTKFGRLVLYAKRDLDEFLASRRRHSTSDRDQRARP